MDISKIKKKYCTDNKVQVMFSNAPSQIICSKDGYLYLRHGDLTIHRYLSDPQRKMMPYKNHPTSKDHASHLLKYDQVYVKFTRFREMGNALSLEADTFTLSFLYFKKDITGEAICSEMLISDLESEPESVEIMNKQEVEKFLYDISDVTGKYIFESMYGIRYASSKNEEITIKRFLDLSDDSIIKSYNNSIRPFKIVNYSKECKNEPEDESYKVSSIDEVKEFTITHSGIFSEHNPIMVVINEQEVIAYKFKIIYCGKDSYKLEKKKIKILPENLPNIRNPQYPPDPDFDE